jgi:hypothetical protein
VTGCEYGSDAPGCTSGSQCCQQVFPSAAVGNFRGLPFQINSVSAFLLSRDKM